ncbi:acyltransferase [Paenarthrobacter nitroguajacolicus]|uniref:Acyltransferase n=1 Tax=Paenarthrobacter nitroguajacolicus TaxID=211146 RepID=A0A558H8N6_PAENT|nr:acyltransferase family protein [Paenarthrobacter nitroguajacolicus]TVU65486.1 acyltransferase [Paenarthrobacter nitroguajacolicus]
MMDIRAREAAPAAKERTTTKPGFRPEVQGLRALAVLMVAAYHIWLGRVSGGVDVFLLISAFLLTLSFTRKLENRKPLRLLQHWLHVFKRLLPAVVVVLLAILAGTWALIPQSRWPDVLTEAWASLTYRQNWQLAAFAVDYYAQQHVDASPLQHFWSLSVQGQVFILWPLIFAGVALLQPRLATWFPQRKAVGHRQLLFVAFGAVFVASLVFSIEQTYSNQAYAYFDTCARLWEFALGSLLALALPYLKPGRRLRVVLGWAGIAAMLACGLLLTVDRSFPGFVALWPTLAAACVIVAGQSGSRWGVDRILSSRPLVGVGGISYALYLWHWPILVFFLLATDTGTPGIVEGLGIMAAATVLAMVTTRCVEEPMRRWKWPDVRSWRAAVVIAACGALLALPVTAWQGAITAEATAIAAQPHELTPGAAALSPEYVGQPSEEARIIPAPAAMKDEWANVDGACTGDHVPSDPVLEGCLQNEEPEVVTKRIVVLGDSHSQQYMAALGPIAKQHGWEVVTLLKGGCRFGAQSEERPDFCNEFNKASSAYVLEHKPDAVFTVASLTHVDAPFETEVPGYLEGIKPFTDLGIEVVGVRDNPRFSFNMPECVQKKGKDSPDCNVPLEQSLADASPLDDYVGKVDGLHLLDMSDFICEQGTCPAVVGNVYVYKDDNHLSKTYVQSMIPMFEERLLAATGWSSS